MEYLLHLVLNLMGNLVMDANGQLINVKSGVRIKMALFIVHKKNASLSLSDMDICKYYTEDMRLKGDSNQAHPIPEGEPFIIFCIFQGKQGPVQALIDSNESQGMGPDWSSPTH